MNIDDFKELDQIPDNPLHYIFDKQRELMEKYHVIEEANGLLQTPDVPVDLHDSKGQARLKDFAWRTMEEIGEALESKYRSGSLDHTQEEMADALHFLVEMCILSGVTATDILEGYEGLRELWYSRLPLASYAKSGPLSTFVLDLGTACNFLKNKPWKQTHILTDEVRFKKAMITAFKSFLYLCFTMGIPNEEVLFQLYFRKSEVNKFRQRSNY